MIQRPRIWSFHEMENRLVELPDLKRVLEEPGGYQGGSGFTPGFVPSGSPSGSVTERETAERVHTSRVVRLLEGALGRLPEELHELVRVRYLYRQDPRWPQEQEISHEQAAAVLGLARRTYFRRREMALVMLIAEVYFQECVERLWSGADWAS